MRSASRPTWIRYLGRSGGVVHEQRHRYRFSSWNTLYRLLLEAFGRERYVLDHEMVSWAHAGDDGQRDLRQRGLGRGGSAGVRRRGRLQLPAPGCSLMPPPAMPATWPGAAWCRKARCEPALAAPALRGDHLPRRRQQPHPGLPDPGPRWLGGPGRAADQFRLVSQLPRRRGSRRPAGRSRRRAPAALPAAGQRGGPSSGRGPRYCQGAAAGRHRARGAEHGRPFRAGRLRHRDRAHGLRSGLPDRRCGLRRPAPCGGGYGQGGRRRLGPGGSTRCRRRASTRRWPRGSPAQLRLGKALVERARRIGARSQVDNAWHPGDPELLFGLHAAGEP